MKYKVWWQSKQQHGGIVITALSKYAARSRFYSHYKKKGKVPLTAKVVGNIYTVKK